MKGGDAPIGQDGEKMWWQEEMEHSMLSQTLLGRPLRESGEELQTERTSIRLQMTLKPHRSIQEPK